MINRYGGLRVRNWLMKSHPIELESSESVEKMLKRTLIKSANPKARNGLTNANEINISVIVCSCCIDA